MLMIPTGGKKHRRIIVWMRRAWRVQDNSPLWNAIRDAEEVVPVVCLNEDARFRESTPRRLFVRKALQDLDARLRDLGSHLTVRAGNALQQIPAAAAAHDADAVYAVDLCDAHSKERDALISARLHKDGRTWVTFKDVVAFDGTEVLAGSGNPYKVFTPYKKAWLKKEPEIPPPLPPLRSLRSPAARHGDRTLGQFPGFAAGAGEGGETSALRQLKRFIASGLPSYRDTRDLPAIDGTSRLSPDLSLGTISIRTILWKVLEKRKGAGRKERENIDCFLSELIWREFYYQILFHFPRVTTGAFRPEFDGLAWSDNRKHFAAWCDGRTGYPIVDAGMRQLNQEGWMHNRVRMIVASFLTKDLHVNWQWGERYFFHRLIDADIASNNGGWQWTAGTGTDASPWFRIFNPVTQGERFDPRGEYVRRYVPELEGLPDRYVHKPWEMLQGDRPARLDSSGPDYPPPLVNHIEERRVTLEIYRNPRPLAGKSLNRKETRQ
jgi:deoxyribodipyrimidine photo-lyase